MRVMVWLESLAETTGGIKHGLSLLVPLIGPHEVTIYHKVGKGSDIPTIATKYGLDLAGADLISYEWEGSLSRISEGYDYFINLSCPLLIEGRARTNVLVTYFPMPLDDVGERRGVDRSGLWLQRRKERLLGWVDRAAPSLGAASFSDYRAESGTVAAFRRLPFFALRKLAWSGRPRYRLGRSELRAYDAILTISEFTAFWIRMLYGRESVLIYPPIDVERFTPATKELQILSVGRFVYGPGESTKRFEVLLSSFKRLHDEGTLKGWRLFFCGGRGPGDLHEDYVGRLRREAEGYPVSIEVDADFSRVRDLYARSTLYWHAKGYGEDLKREPWRAEHFGMTTVEAMAAGCVPMAFAGGGQTEIITHRSDGFLWSDPGQLEQSARDFVAMPDDERAAMAAAAMARSGRFSTGNFLAGARAAYESLGLECR